MDTFIHEHTMFRIARHHTESGLTPTAPSGARGWWQTCERAGRAFWRDDVGQDVIEYGLLAALVAVIGIGVWAAIQGDLRAAYINYDRDVQALSDPPPPGGGQ